MARRKAPRYADIGFKFPFASAHCVPLAYGLASGITDPGELADFAQKAREQGILHGDGYAYRKDVMKWLELAGLSALEYVKYEMADGYYYSEASGRYRRRSARPRLKTFLNQHKEGTWIIYTRRHAQVAFNGQVRGTYRPNSRVQMAIRVEKKAV